MDWLRNMDYHQVNWILDLLLAVFLSFYVLPEAPKIYFLLIAINVAQYVVPVPQVAGSGKAGVLYGEVAYERQADGTMAEVFRKEGAPSAFEGLPPVEEPPKTDLPEGVGGSARPSGAVQALGQTTELMQKVYEGIGGEKDLGAEVRAAVKEQTGLELPVGTAPEVGGGGSMRAKETLGEIWRDMGRDPQALWLLVRIFWLLGALALFVQRPMLGAAAACMNLLPMVYLARAVPAWIGWLNTREAVARVNLALHDGEEAGALWESAGFWVVVLAVLGVPLFLGGVWVLRRGKGRAARCLRDFLDPRRYRVVINGNTMDFTVQGRTLWVEGMAYPLKAARGDGAEPGRWRLGTGTEILFVEREAGAGRGGG